MTPERWQLIDRLFHEALAKQPGERAAFLANTCAGDESLQREVQSLISSHEDGQSFIEAAAGDIAAEILGAQSRFAPGQQIGTYKIIRQLGSGGMGEVYLATDTKLGRKVALKLLPEVFTADVDRVRRFEQEARAASALNHPNILTIHEINEDGFRFIATEFVDGQTLRQRLIDGPLEIIEVLQISEQVASALAAAQTEGITHRDIKPENIMLRHDGIVKILDFGLAKLSEDRVAAPDDPTRALLKTSAGVVMGTTHYMSPEQARGLKVDGRTDIFSLGAVLYEMISGEVAFKGDTSSDVIASVLKTQPPLLSSVAPDSPPELERIVTKALEKDREERYQTVKDMALDLRRLKQRLTLENEQSRFQVRSDGNTSAAAASRADGAAVDASATMTAQVQAISTKSSAEYLLSEIKQHKRAVFLALALFLTVAAVSSYFLYTKLIRKPPSSPLLKTARLTSSGKATRAVISPDGKYVVYSIQESGQESLWMSQVGVSSDVQIVPPADVSYTGLTFSHDGKLLYYVRNEQGKTGVLYQASSLGGNARKLLSDVNNAITLSIDGKQIAFVRAYPSNPGGDALMVANADGTESRVVYQLPVGKLFGGTSPAWSPDNMTIAFGVQNYSGSFYSTVSAVRVADGSLVPVTSRRWSGMEIGRLAWATDGSGLFLTVNEGPTTQIWYLSTHNDETRQLVNDLNGYHDISVASQTGTLVAIRNDRMFNISIAPASDLSRTKLVTSGSERNDGVFGLDWTPDGRILYRSSAGGPSNIWIIATDGTANKQLSAANINTTPEASADGRYVVWVSRSGATDVNQIWRMDIDGGNQKQLTPRGGSGTWLPSVSPDAKWIVYGIKPPETLHTLWKVSIDGGDPIQLTKHPSWAPAFSPNGNSIACNWLDEATGRWNIAILPANGGEPTKILNTPGPYTRLLRWAPDGTIAFIQTTNGVSNIWSQSLNGGPPKQLTNFKDQVIQNFRWSRDGKQLALSRGFVNSDVVLISGF